MALCATLTTFISSETLENQFAFASKASFRRFQAYMRIAMHSSYSWNTDSNPRWPRLVKARWMSWRGY